MKGHLEKIKGVWWLVNRTGGMSLERFFPNINNWPDTLEGARAEFSRLPMPILHPAAALPLTTGIPLTIVKGGAMSDGDWVKLKQYQQEIESLGEEAATAPKEE